LPAQVAIEAGSRAASNYLTLSEIRLITALRREFQNQTKEIPKMAAANVRSLFAGSMVLALTMGVSAFTFAQYPSQPAAPSSSTAGQPDASAKSGGASDKQFVTKAAQGGMAEVELGQLAASKGSNDAVKQFGQKMVDDHGKANEELKSLAQQKNITLPSEPDAKTKSEKARLEKLSGEAFDKAYISHMVTDHKKDVAEFKKESSSGKDPDVKQWAGKTLPTLQEHLKLAQDTASKVGASTGKTAAKKSPDSSTAQQ